MSHRVSAGELELRYKLKHLLFDFFEEMLSEMRRNLEEKGFSWRDETMETFLKEKLAEHVQAGNWLAVANYAFMLRDREVREQSEFIDSLAKKEA